MTARFIPTVALVLFLVLGLPATAATTSAQEAAAKQDQGSAAETKPSRSSDEDAASQEGAEREAPEDDTLWHERLVVTATRGDLAATDIPLHTSVITRDEVRMAPDTSIGDVVRQITSINLYAGARNPIASPRDQSLNFRGLGGSNVSRGLLLVDGFPMLDPYNASVIWNKVPKDLVEKVEVVRGGGSSVWGNLALSGVVNLITRAPDDRGLTASLLAGDKSTKDATASFSGSAGSWAAWGAANLFDSDGYIALREEDRGSIDQPESKQFESLTARSSYAISSNAALQLGALIFSEDRSGRTPIEAATNDEYDLNSTVDVVSDGGSSWQVRFYARDQSLEDHGSRDAADRNSQDPSSHIYDLSSTSAGITGLYRLAPRDKHAITTGLDLQSSSIDRREDLDWETGQYTTRSLVKGSQQLGGLFIEDSFSPGPRWSLHLAGRLDAIRTYDGKSLTTDLLTAETAREDLLKDNTETSFNPNIGFVYEATGSLRIRGSAYTGFKSAMPSELFVGSAPRSNRITVPNPALQPETLVGTEAGFDFDPSRRFSVRLTGFWNEVDDLIQRITVGRVGSSGGVVEPCGLLGPGGQCRQRRNIGQMRSTGFDLESQYRPHRNWRFTVAATILDAEITENADDPDLVGNRIEGVPEERVALGLHYTRPELFSAVLRGRYVGDRFDDAENEDYLPSHFALDLSLSRRLTQRWDAFAGVTNLLDREFAVSIGSAGIDLGEPRLIHVGLRLNGFGRG